MRRVRVFLAAVALMAGSLLLPGAAAPAFADTSYPPGPAPTVAPKAPTPPAPPARVVRGRVAFTGDNIARWAAVAFVLVAIGGSLVIMQRRRDGART